MKICTFLNNKTLQSGIKRKNEIIPLKTFNRQFGLDLPESLDKMILDNNLDAWESINENLDLDNIPSIPLSKIKFCAPFYNPPKIIGIGLNFTNHAQDLQAEQPQQEPATFMKPATSIIGPEDTITLPKQSSWVTGEAEIGVIIQKECKNISITEANKVILGYTTIIDMTAVDILKRNPRFLTRAKSFDTFFSFGPWIITRDEIRNIEKIQIETIINGRQHCINQVKNMRFPPLWLVSFLSQNMTLKPGDIISCGTPGAVTIQPEDRIGCYIKEIGRMENKVSHYK